MRKFTTLAVLLVVGLFVAAAPVEARSLDYPSYDVDIVVDKNSVVTVTEKLTIRFTGEYQGVLADIPLRNPQRDRECERRGKACGGFDSITLLGVYDANGVLVDRKNYEVSTYEDEDTEVEYFSIRWTVWPGGKNFDGKETFTWSFKYRLYGALGFTPANQGLLYWNAIPEDRGGMVSKGSVNITLPEGVVADDKNLNVYLDIAARYQTQEDANELFINTGSLPLASGDFTIEYLLPAGAVDRPAKLVLNKRLPFLISPTVKFNGEELELGIGTIPTGKHSIELSYSGYQSQIIEINPKSGEVITIDVNLQPGAFVSFLILLSLCASALSLLLLPVALWRIYSHWRRKGRDQAVPGTVVPLYKPSAHLRPYLMGALQDETVNTEDITGSIIDLAYRGFLKIKEIKKGSNYELTRLDGKPGETLDEIEQQILDGLFKTDETVVETKDIGTRFLMKFNILKTKIYDKMVTLGFFERAPQHTRNKYYGIGALILVLGIFALVMSLSLGWIVTGIPGAVLLGVVLIIIAIATFIIAPHMPSKTPTGSKAYYEVLGFKMYMHYTERYRVQNLEPEDFVKYLGYAVVFKLEKQWADSFKDLYLQAPDWYEGDISGWDIYWTQRFLSDFSNGLNSTVYTPVNNSASGSGWSGGGSFGGGFSGGGGGGGGRGGF